MMRKFAYSLAALVVLSLIVLAQGQKSETLTGYIVDKACSARVLKKDNPQEAAAGESKACVLRDGCFKSGLGVFVAGKWTEFDENGNALAKAALEKSTKDKGAMFKVTGKVAEGKMTVESISEVE
ncbi:MAG: hypothetical protein ACREEM_30565 [Blastocatellia bacterium]